MAGALGARSLGGGLASTGFGAGRRVGHMVAGGRWSLARRGCFSAVAKWEGVPHPALMSSSSALPSAAPAGVADLNATEVFSILGNERRRRLLVALSNGVGQAASQLAPLIGRTQDSTMKHLLEMKAADLVTMARDPVDERRMLYTLNPAILVRRTEAGLEMDFDCCLMRVK